MNGKFVIGHCYYELGFRSVDNKADKAVAHIATWVYRGYVKESFSSESCDTPHHFHEFSRAGALPPLSDNDRILIPSLAQASESKLTWSEFVTAIGDVLDDSEFDVCGGL